MNNQIMEAWDNVKTYPDGSTGNYTCECITCGAWFTGHKRDVTCPGCEEKKPKQFELDLADE